VRLFLASRLPCPFVGPSCYCDPCLCLAIGERACPCVGGCDVGCCRRHNHTGAFSFGQNRLIARRKKQSPTRHNASEDPATGATGLRGVGALRSDHPLTAPAYSEQRSTFAKALGFGRKSKAQAAPEVSPTAATSAVEIDQGSDATQPRRRRSRVASKSADAAKEAVAATPTGGRRSRSASKSLTADGENAAVAEPKSTSKRRPRSRVASTQPEQTPLATAET